MDGGAHDAPWRGTAESIFGCNSCCLWIGRTWLEHSDPHWRVPGIGKLILMDFDCVDITNLHRQQYKITQIGMPKTEAMVQNLREINPYIDTEIHTVRITTENAVALLQEADIVCEAFDNPEAKAMLTNLVLEQFPQKYFVAGSGMAGFGDPNMIRTRKLTEHFYLCGDGCSDVADGVGLVASRVMICAAHQAHTILRILAKEQ